MRVIRQVAAAGAAAVVALHGCGGTGSETAGIDAGGVRQPVTAQGPITGFGSIIVGGVHYDVDRAVISVNGAPSATAELAIGQLVVVEGTRDDDGLATADSVVFDSNVEGPVYSVDYAGGTLIVLGQEVKVDTSTVFDLGSRAPGIGSLAAADRVQISGFVAGDDSIVATRIALLPPGKLRVRGEVDGLDRAAGRFELNELTVDYRAAFVIEGFPTGAPSDGDEVVVVGSTLRPNGELMAEEFVRISDPELDTGQEAEVEGLITRFVAPADFDVAGVRVSASADTAYEGGTAASLRLNVKVKVDGRVDSGGAIDAEKIEIKDGGRVVAAP